MSKLISHYPPKATVTQI